MASRRERPEATRKRSRSDGSITSCSIRARRARQDAVWQALSAYSPGGDGIDRDPRACTEIFRAPYKRPSLCWADLANPNPPTLAEADDYNMAPIEFFVFGDTVRPMVVAGSKQQVVCAPATSADTERLSKHCPSALKISG